MHITIVKQITSQDFDELVVDTYGRPYCFQQQDGCRSRGQFDLVVPVDDPEDFDATELPEEINGEERGVSFVAWLARDPRAAVGDDDADWCIDLFWHRNFYPSTDMLLNDLHARGLIEAGEYTLVVDW